MAKVRHRKHVPQRTCIVCREKMDKRRLTRLVRAADGTIVVDSTGKQAGRGAYLCDRRTCWNQALQTNLLDRAFKATVTPAQKDALADHLPSAGSEDIV